MRGVMGRLGEEWMGLHQATQARGIDALCRALGFDLPPHQDHDDMVPLMALNQLGFAAANVVREPQFKISRAKAVRDADLERPTLHLAPIWRHAGSDEAGSAAIILPVCSLDWRGQASMCVGDFPAAEDFAAAICDLIAIPLDGARPMSLTGHSDCIGELAAQDGRLTLYGSGIAWLKAYLTRARDIAADYPVHLVPQPFPAPDADSVLLLEPRALDWCVQSPACIVPADAREIACPDSRVLALLVDQMMRKKPRTRSIPPVLGPKVAGTA
jgi:hypothetical protein